jgi:transposase-like protein
MMKTDPSGKAVAAELQEQIEHARASGGLEQVSSSQLLGLLLDSLFRAERSAYIERVENDKGNGSYERAVNVGSLGVEVDVPRTRSGDFRPSKLPAPCQRGYDDAARDLLFRLAASSRSLNAAKEALRGLGLPASEPQLETVTKHFITEFEVRNTRPLDTDWLALFIDAKYVEVRDGDRLRPYGVYVAVGLGRDGIESSVCSAVRSSRAASRSKAGRPCFDRSSSEACVT